MGNSASQRVSSPSPSLGFYFSYSINDYLVGLFKHKSIFIPQNSSSTGLAIIHDSVSLGSTFIVFPPLTALQILHSAPGELWNWNHPKPRDFSTTHAITTRDGTMVPMSPDEITCSEEYTCVVSTKDGYSKMTHFYRNTIVDCHPIARSPAAIVVDGDKHRRMYRGETFNCQNSMEYLNYCYICSGTNKHIMRNTSMHKDGGLYTKENDIGESVVKLEIKETMNEKKFI